jgi:hypothetical protein
VGFSVALIGHGELLALPLGLMISRCDRFRRPGKSSGPPSFAPSLNVQGDVAHNSSGLGGDLTPLNRQTASQSRANGGGHNCVPNKDRADFPLVWESDHTIAVVLGALRPMLGAEAIADFYKSESPAWGERGFLMGEAEGGDRALHK